MTKKKEFRLIVYGFVMIIIIFGGRNISVLAEDENLIIQFPDQNLKNALIEIGVDTDLDGEISREEMVACKQDSVRYDEGIHGFDLSNKGIADITGLEYAVNIDVFILKNNPIKDLSPIANLKNLGILSFVGCDLSDVDLSPIMELNELKILDLFRCNINDLSVFEKATFTSCLAYLNLTGNNVTDINPLKHLTNMRQLYLSKNQIEDISALENMNYLYELNICENSLTNIDALQNKTNLGYLFLADNNIEDISSIESSVKLLSLDVAGNKIKNIDSLVNMKKMTSVELAENEIEDISPLQYVSGLESVSLGGNKIVDISPLENVTSLTDVVLAYNEVKDVSPLANIKNLTVLILDDNNIEDISCLAPLTNLTLLSVENNRISDISVIANFINLKKLYLLGNNITDLNAIKGLNLDFVDMTEEHIAELSISGVEDGGVYDTDRVVTYEGGRGTFCPVIEGGRNIPNQLFNSGDTFTNNCSYVVRVTHITGKELTVRFTIDKKSQEEPEQPIKELEKEKSEVLIEDSSLPVLGVIDNNTYERPVTVFFEGTGELNGQPISNGDIISDDGHHNLKITNKGKYRDIKFFIDKQPKEKSLFKRTAETTPSEWSEETIKEAYKADLLIDNVITGYKDTINRVDFCNLIMKLYEKKNAKTVEPAPSSTFIDTQDKGVLQANQLNIISGIGEGLFNPMGTLTREQMAVIADKFLQISYDQYKDKELVSFKDEQNISTWAREAVQRLASNNILNGVGNDMFAPEKEVTKEQAIAMIYKLYNMKEFGIIHVGEDLSICIKKDGKVYKEFLVNHRTFTLPPYSAIYLYTGLPNTTFIEEPGIYCRGDKILENNTNQYKVIKSGEFETPIIYRANNTEGPYIRTAILKRPFNENNAYHMVSEDVLLVTNWQNLRTGLYYDK